MRIETLHRTGACSSLLALSLSFSERGIRFKTCEEFAEELKRCLDRDAPLDHINKPHQCREYAYLFASTNNSSELNNIKSWLRLLGFQEVPETYNCKNATKVIMFWITVKEIMERVGCNSKWIEPYTGEVK